MWGLIEGHTRGRGMPVDAPPPADLASVALAATLRLAPNPVRRTSETKTSTDGATHRVEGSFAGWTLAAVLVLNRYRRRVRCRTGWPLLTQL